MKPYIKYIDRDILTSPYCIGLCQSEKAFMKELIRLKIPIRNIPEWVSEGKDACVHYLMDNNAIEKCVIVCIRERKNTKYDEIVGLIIHEAVHVWQWICEEINERAPSTEFEAYAIQNISQKFISEYKIRGKK